MKKLNKDFGNIMMILGAVIGAGLASGQEIVIFFAQYGFVSILFAFLFFILFSYGLIQTLKYGKFISQKADFLQNNQKNFIFSSCEGIIFLIFSSTMVAGADSLLNEFVFAFDFKLWSILILLLSIIVASKGLKWMINVNKVLVPMIIVSTIVICVLSFFFSSHSDVALSFDFSNLAFLGISAVLYAACNLMVVNKITTQLGAKIEEKNIKKVAIISSLILFFIIAFIIVSLLVNDNSILFVSLPMVYLAFMVHPTVGYVYATIILFCIFTTLISTFYSLKECVQIKIKSNFLSCALSCIMIFVLSLFGFDSIVRYSYPLIGALGIIMIYNIKNRMEIAKCPCGEKF